MNYKPINLSKKLSLIREHFSPRIAAQLNDYYFKLCKFKGDFVWHKHTDTDEAFYVIEGDMRIDFRDGYVQLKAGELYVVPRGIEHKPSAENE